MRCSNETCQACTRLATHPSFADILAWRRFVPGGHHDLRVVRRSGMAADDALRTMNGKDAGLRRALSRAGLSEREPASLRDPVDGPARSRPGYFRRTEKSLRPCYGR